MKHVGIKNPEVKYYNASKGAKRNMKFDFINKQKT